LGVLLLEPKIIILSNLVVCLGCIWLEIDLEENSLLGDILAHFRWYGTVHVLL